MKNLSFVIIFLISLSLKGQDPSFSQFDLNMLYSNPAFSGYEGSTKILSHSRMQWTSLTQNFNSSIFEFNSSIKLNPENRRTQTLISPGLSIINQDLGIFEQIGGPQGNEVWLNKMDIKIHGAIHLKLSENNYSSGGFSVGYRQYSLNTQSLIFSNQWGEFGDFTNYSDLVFQPETGFINHVDKFDFSYGGIWTRQGSFRETQGNRQLIAFSTHNVLREIESFWNPSSNDAKTPIKQITQVETYYGIPKNIRTPFPYIKSLFRHERYHNNWNIFPLYWEENLMSKTEYGATLFTNRIPMEFGLLVRRIRQKEDTTRLILNEQKSQSLIPLIRYRFNKSKNIWIISYSTDINISLGNDGLNLNNTSLTHEFGISIYFSAGRRRIKECPAFGIMQNNPLYQDIMNEGMMNKRKTTKNFK